MSYIPSVNIEHNSVRDFNYIVTENARLVVASLVNGFDAGHHSFTLIGTYGTGKSSFLLALEEDLKTRASRMIASHGVFNNAKDFEFLNIVGDYTSLSRLLSQKLDSEENNIFEALNAKYKKLRSQNKFMVIVVDEFGKILEHAANNNPEKELYFLQKLAEFVNVPSRNILLLTTLHQNFGSYAHKLTVSQKNEWQKVKGRFEEVVFVEPVEQLLYLTAQQLVNRRKRIAEASQDGFQQIYNHAISSRVTNDTLKYKTVLSLYPLDAVSAICLTLAIQRYGQNERSLFSFLNAAGPDSLKSFVESVNTTYNLARVYDYLKYHYYSALTESNSDSTGWRAISVALERIENSECASEFIIDCSNVIKTIGLLNIFFNGIKLDKIFLATYGRYALGISNPQAIIDWLSSHKLIRFASYKNQYILFEGTNLDLEDELYKASSVVPRPILSIEEIGGYIRQKAVVANASYYETGTPRFFEIKIANEGTIEEPTGDIDGFIHLIFPLSDIESEIQRLSAKKNSGANIYAYFKNTDIIVRHLHTIKKIQYVIDNVAVDDRVAIAELSNQKQYEEQKLNAAINDEIISPNSSIVWYFHGEQRSVKSLKDLNRLVSLVCSVVYDKTPIIKNELFNKQRLSSAISLARVNLLDAMLLHSDEPDFGYPEQNFPPEKTIYYTLFRESGIHRQDENGNWILGAPTTPELQTLWEVCARFLHSSVDKPKRLTELVRILQTKPYKLKQGVIDFWLPIFLYVNQQDFALYNGNFFVLKINKEVFELLQKRLKDFSVKAFDVSGVRLEFFKRYRQFLRKDDSIGVSSDSLMETVKPFFHFYRTLNNYAKHTRKFDNPFTAQFRDVLSKAQDPAKTFFEDLPEALGYRNFNNEEFVGQYLDLIRTAVRDLNTCYDLFIDRIEGQVIEHLGLPRNFDEYKAIISNRYSTINAAVLTPKSKSFLERVLSASETRKEFFEKICMVVNDKRLDETKDSEEGLLVKNLLYLLSELERASAISNDATITEGEEAFNFELATSSGSFSHSQTYRLPAQKKDRAERMISALSAQLSGDDDLDICVLLKLLNTKIK